MILQHRNVFETLTRNKNFLVEQYAALSWDGHRIIYHKWKNHTK